MTGKFKITSLCLALFLLFSCKEKEEKGRLSLAFTFSVDENELTTHELIYTNAAGNLYQVDEVKFFISDVVLINTEGKTISIRSNNSVHYVDYDIEETKRWSMSDALPVGDYSGIRFIFGLSREKNLSYAFPNPPESNMAWPAVLGGGYHYMQINGKWSDNGVLSPINIHSGISKLYSVDSLISYRHNFFTVEATVPFTIKKDQVTTLTAEMNINNWFVDPHIFDFSEWGPGIMENEEAQRIIQENGGDVFLLR